MAEDSGIDSAGVSERIEAPFSLGLGTLIVSLISIVLIIMRLGTLDTPPTWDSAMSVWPAAIEMAERGSISEVLGLPTYLDGGPNTHTLSLVTLVTAGVISTIGVGAAIAFLHWVNIGLLVAIGLIVVLVVSRYLHRFIAVLLGLTTVLFPLMLAQSAYLYTDLASSAFVMAALYVASRRRFGYSTLLLLVAVAIKPLALVAVPALMTFSWRSGSRPSQRLMPLLATVGVIPALMVPTVARVSVSQLDLAQLIWHRTGFFVSETPEVLLLLAIPVATGLRLVRSPHRDDAMWFWPVCILLVSFASFFALTPLVTAGHVFLPRYAVMIVGPAMVLLGLLIRTLSITQQAVGLTLVIVVFVLGARGPLAWGADTSIPPIAERSLAFVELFEAHRAGMTRLAELSKEGMPVFSDHYSGFGFSYPELGHFSGEISNWTTIRSSGYRPTSWGEDLEVLPDRFAMLAGAPILGSDRFRLVQMSASHTEGYEVREEVFGSARVFPIEVILVERTTPPGE